MTGRTRNSKRARTIVLETHGKTVRGGRVMMRCHCCQVWFYPADTAWRADHVVLWSNGGRDTPENLLPIMKACDVGKKASADTTQAAKNKRVRDKHLGIREPSRGFWKPEGVKFNWKRGRYE
jgi:hypothetical protein